MKFCKDCKYYEPPPSPGLITDFCNHPDVLDIVTGGATNPRVNRSPYGQCGPDAKLWETIAPKP